MIKVSPSVLSADFCEMGNVVDKLSDWGADYIHCDVVDGRFAPNITFGPKMIADIKKRAMLPLDVHLMIVEPEKYTDAFIDAGADIVTVHAEAVRHLDRLLRSIKARGVKCGVALNPGTSLNTLDYVIDEIDLLLLMSVNPGFSGQSFIDYIPRKIEEARKLIADRNVMIEIDGGASAKNAAMLDRCGADILVAGNGVFCAPDPGLAIKNMKEACR